jgi:HK97 family phage major capsid protein
MSEDPKDKVMPGFEELNTQCKNIVGQIEQINKDYESGKKSQTEQIESVKKATEDLDVKIKEFETSQKNYKDQVDMLEKALAKLEPIGQKEGGLTADDFKAMNLQIKSNNPNREFTHISDDNIELVCKAHELYVKHGTTAVMGELSAEEFKYVNSIVGPQGGFTIPMQSSQTVTPKAFDGRAGLELVGRQIVSTGQYVDYIDEADYNASAYGNDLSATGTDTNDEGLIELEWNAKEQIYTKRFSRTFLEDSWNPASYYIEQMIDGMTRDTAQAIITGKKVNGTIIQGFAGILEAEEGTAPAKKVQYITSTNSAADLAFSWDDAIKLQRALSDRYHANSNYLMRRATFFDLFLTKDSEGRYQVNNLVNFFTAQGSAVTILGRNVGWEAGLPDTLTSGNKPVLFGDFAQGYMYIERVGLSIIRDETNPRYIKLHLRRRNSGGLRLSEAIKGLKMKS